METKLIDEFFEYKRLNPEISDSTKADMYYDENTSAMDCKFSIILHTPVWIPFLHNQRYTKTLKNNERDKIILFGSL